MFRNASRGWLGLVNSPISFTVMALAMLVTALGGSAAAQTQTSPNTGDAVAAMVASAKAEPALIDPTADPVVSPKATGKTKPQGAGSDNHGYIFIRGYVFQVHRGNGNPAVINSSGGNVLSVDDFNYGAEGAFKVEAGWNATNNFGFRASYFYTTQSADEDRTQVAGPPFFISPRPLNVLFTGSPDVGTTANFRERFRMHVIDLEGSYKWHNPNWSVLISGGVRIAPTRQVYTVQDTCCGGIAENLNYTQKRTGVGPTVAIDFRHRIGGSNWWWTGAARAAALFGKIKETATYTGLGPPLSAARNDSRSNGVFEGEIGLEWSHTFGSGNQFFLNGSFITHHWANIVNVMPVSPTGSSSTALLDNPLVASTRQGGITFVGGAFSFGFRF